VDQNEPVDIASQIVPASDYTSTELRDVTVTLGPVGPNDLWAGQPVGVAIRSVGPASGFWDLDHVRVSELLPSYRAVENPSFEGPVVDPNGFPVLPFVDQWVELDQDVETSSNTGVFINTPIGAADHVVNAEGLQLAYLGAEQGNALEQALTVSYDVGSGYRLTVGVGISDQFPPSPENSLELVMTYHDGNEPVVIVSESVPVLGLSATELKDVSVYLSPVEANQDWAGLPMGVALRSVGLVGGFWDLDHVRLGMYHFKIDLEE
jgi:hypothetical protein